MQKGHSHAAICQPLSDVDALPSERQTFLPTYFLSRGRGLYFKQQEKTNEGQERKNRGDLPKLRGK